METIMAEYIAIPQILSCPTWHGASYTPMNTHNRTYVFNATVLVYQITCGVNLSALTNAQITDIMHIPSVSSLPLCIDLCARYTLEVPIVQSSSNQICHAVTLDEADVCWLKTDNGSSSYINTADDQTSAILQQ